LAGSKRDGAQRLEVPTARSGTEANVIRRVSPARPFVFGPLFAVAYNAELFGGLIHTDAGFAATWGAFPVLTA